MTLHKTKLAIAVTVVAATVVTWAESGASQDGGDDQTKAHINRFLNDPHGLNRLSPQDREKLEEIKRVFGDPHVALLRDALRLPNDDRGLDDNGMIQRHQRGLILLAKIGGVRARAVVLEDYRRVTARRRIVQGAHANTEEIACARARNARILANLRRTALEQLGHLRADEAIGDVLNEVESSDVATQIVMLRYLRRAAVGNDTVLRRLEAMHENPQSSIANNPDVPLAQTIEHLREANAQRGKQSDERDKGKASKAE